MKNRIVYILFLAVLVASAPIIGGCQPSFRPEPFVRLPQPPARHIPLLQTIGPVQALYLECRLAGKLRFDIFENAMYGYRRLRFPEKNIITIIDFTRPSSEKRLFVIDLAQKKILYHTYVAHGVNSGYLYPVRFSNEMNSKESSLGFYETGETYTGKYGYSLRLDGLERGINDMARERDIVMHGADYVGRNVVRAFGCVGRSWGCPALPESLSATIIETIKDGTCLYIYADDKDYIAHSRYVVSKKANRWSAELGMKN